MGSFSTAYLAMLGLLASTPVQADLTKVSIGYSVSSELLPAFVAKEKNLFAKRGLDATLSAVPISSTIPAALVSRTLDIGMTSPTAILIADEGGLDMVGICATNRLLPNNPRIGLVTKPGFEVTPAALSGLRIGIPGFYSSIEVMFRKWALDRGVRPEQMTLIEVPLPQMSDVLRGGRVDAVTAIEPFTSRIVTSVPGTKSFDYVKDLSPDALGAMWMAPRAWADGNAETVSRFVGAYEDGIAEIQRDPDEARRIEAKYVGSPGPAFPSFSTRLTAEDLEFYQSMMLDLNLLRTRQDVSKLIFRQ